MADGREERQRDQIDRAKGTCVFDLIESAVYDVDGTCQDEKMKNERKREVSRNENK